MGLYTSNVLPYHHLFLTALTQWNKMTKLPHPNQINIIWQELGSGRHTIINSLRKNSDISPISAGDLLDEPRVCVFKQFGVLLDVCLYAGLRPDLRLLASTGILRSKLHELSVGNHDDEVPESLSGRHIVLPSAASNFGNATSLVDKADLQAH